MNNLTRLREKKLKQKGLRLSEWKWYASLLQEELEKNPQKREELEKEHQRVSNVLGSHKGLKHKKPLLHSSKLKNMTHQLWKETNDVTKEHRVPLESLVGYTYRNGNN